MCESPGRAARNRSWRQMRCERRQVRESRLTCRGYSHTEETQTQHPGGLSSGLGKEGNECTSPSAISLSVFEAGVQESSHLKLQSTNHSCAACSSVSKNKHSSLKEEAASFTLFPLYSVVFFFFLKLFPTLS